MTDKVFLNADKTAVVDEFGPGKKWKVDRAEAERLGLLKKGETKPQTRRTEAFDASKATAPSEPAPKKRTTRRKRK